jgi:hypothetical protein
VLSLGVAHATLSQLSPVERSVFPDLRRSAGPLRDVDGRCSHQLLPVGGGCRLNAHYVVVTREVVSASRTHVLELIAPVALSSLRNTYIN